MGHRKDRNDELREDRLEQEEQRQELREKAIGEAGDVDNRGSQDERRKDRPGRPSTRWPSV